MASDDDIITQLRIDVAVLKTKLGNAEIALKLAHENVLARIGLAVAVTSIVVTMVVKLVK